jgi:hypothetical protein
MSAPADIGRPPVWDDAVRLLFAEPYWVDAASRAKVGQQWRGCMTGYGIDLAEYASVRIWAVTIYDHLASRAMPLTSDTTQFWPAEALEQLRAWVNGGCPRTRNDPVEGGSVIPPPPPPHAAFRVRRNILDLSPADLNEYRAKLEKLEVTSAAPTSAWQQVAYLHTNWCLHYQESFLLWHRANLLYFEKLVDSPVPYWDFMSPDVTDVDSPDSGIPAAFKEETYTHPDTGEERPNPLRFAVAKGGRSKACANEHGEQRVVGGTPCEFVHRDPVLYTTGDDHRRERAAKLHLVEKFQEQVRWAFTWPVFSTPEGTPGYPWANIQTFHPPPPDSDYPHRCDFDGLYEQPHDNFHGWIGPDMADNSYTAFDPIFWSYHANIDRIFEGWKRQHPGAMFTAAFPLRPFTGADAGTVDQADPEVYNYTTIGDMARDSRALGYEYTNPNVLDERASLASAATSSTPLYVVFGNVKCIRDTYTIDVFLNLPTASPADVHGENSSHYVGRFTRLGMGIDDDKGRCRAVGVTRVLDASAAAHRLGLNQTSPVEMTLVVTDMTRGVLVGPDEYAHLPGFAGDLRWGRQDGGQPAPKASAPSTGPCHSG